MIYEEAEGFRRAHTEALEGLKSKDTIFSMGARQSFYENMGDFLQDHDKTRKTQNIKLKVIGFSSAKKELGKNRPNMEVKYLKEDYPSLVGTSIYGETTLIQVYSQPPIVISIKSKKISESYKKYFDLFWKIAIK